MSRRKEERERSEQEGVLKRGVVIQMSLECGMRCRCRKRVGLQSVIIIRVQSQMIPLADVACKQ